MGTARQISVLNSGMHFSCLPSVLHVLPTAPHLPRLATLVAVRNVRLPTNCLDSCNALFLRRELCRQWPRRPPDGSTASPLSPAVRSRVSVALPSGRLTAQLVWSMSSSTVAGLAWDLKVHYRVDKSPSCARCLLRRLPEHVPVWWLASATARDKGLNCVGSGGGQAQACHWEHSAAWIAYNRATDCPLRQTGAGVEV
jgi:hypothetical protein